MQKKLYRFSQIALFFGVAAAVQADPFLDFIHGLRGDTVSAATDLSIIVIIIGGAIYGFGGRAIGVITAITGALVGLFAVPITNWIQTYAH
jgi:hypothetical protein